LFQVGYITAHLIWHSISLVKKKKKTKITYIVIT
jgi:hypothetical protein